MSPRLPFGVLSQDDVVDVEPLNAAQNFDLFVPDILCVQRNRLFHRKEGHNLQKMILDDISDNSVMIKVPTTAFGAKILREDDLNALDVLPRPERLKDQIRKPQYLHTDFDSSLKSG